MSLKGISLTFTETDTANSRIFFPCVTGVRGGNFPHDLGWKHLCPIQNGRSLACMRARTH